MHGAVELIPGREIHKESHGRLGVVPPVRTQSEPRLDRGEGWQGGARKQNFSSVQLRRRRRLEERGWILRPRDEFRFSSDAEVGGTDITLRLRLRRASSRDPFYVRPRLHSPDRRARDFSALQISTTRCLGPGCVYAEKWLNLGWVHLLQKGSEWSRIISPALGALPVAV